jgi:hypothetical protein
VAGVAGKVVFLGRKLRVSCRLLTPAKQLLCTLVYANWKPPLPAYPLRCLRISSRRPSSSRTPHLCLRKLQLPEAEAEVEGEAEVVTS